MAEYFIACTWCDDGEAYSNVSEMRAAGWSEIEKDCDAKGQNEMEDWWTHLGTCPLCREPKAEDGPGLFPVE